MQTNITTNLALNTKKFLTAIADKTLGSVNYAYPENTIDYSRCHAALQGIAASTKNLKSFLEALEEVLTTPSKPEPLPDPTPEAIYLLMDQKGKPVFEGVISAYASPPIPGNQADLETIAKSHNHNLYRKLI